MSKPTWDERIRRAEELGGTYPFAAEVLRFYERIVSFQKDLYGHVLSACGTQVESRARGSLRNELDLIVLLPRFPVFLSLVERAGSSWLAACAHTLAQEGHDSWMNLLAQYWTANGREKPAHQDSRIFLARAFLQPYAEYLADYTAHRPNDVRPVVCPLCQTKPQVGVLRQEGDGAKRSLICSLCATEWDYRRLVCPACGEENVDKLAVYTASQFPHVRVEACETCRNYIKTVDLTKNGRAVPVVDELATIPLNLWAQEKGYTKLQLNLLGL